MGEPGLAQLARQQAAGGDCNERIVPSYLFLFCVWHAPWRQRRGRGILVGDAGRIMVVVVVVVVWSSLRSKAWASIMSRRVCWCVASFSFHLVRNFSGTAGIRLLACAPVG